MRKSVIAGNWKMNNTSSSADEFLQSLSLKEANCEVVLCVPFTLIPHMSKRLAGTCVALGAQNVSWAESGAYTGEISAQMLAEWNVKYVIVGHSERRQMFGETDQTVNARAKTALKHNLIPIICVGETENERVEGLTEEVLTRQTMNAFAGISASEARNCVVAYEPVWAIGTGKTASVEDAVAGNALIRKVISQMLGQEVADAIRIQYGGSMNAKNASELLAQEEIDGGLIGGASLKPADFLQIISANKN